MKGKPRILLVDTDPSLATQVEAILGDSVGELVSMESGREALATLGRAAKKEQGFSLLLLDYHLAKKEVDVMRQVSENAHDVRVIITSDRDFDDAAVEAMRHGAFDFVSKPLNPAEFRIRVERALRDRQTQPSRPGRNKRKPRKSDVIIGCASWIKDLYERISMVAQTDVTVAISGESGTGKELVARTVHNLSRRFEAPFVIVNCAAIPEALLEDELFGHVRGAFTDASRDREGLFSAADGGTLFLDEIGEMSLALQAKLLRVIQSQEFRRIGEDVDTKVDVRLVTATNIDLDEAVKDGRFRQDLFYRINVFPLVMLPLRERREDIPLLANHFLLLHRNKVSKKVEGFTPAALEKLKAYDYPGNIRELENKIHHALVLVSGKHIGADDIPMSETKNPTIAEIDLSRSFKELKKEIVATFEEQYTRKLLEAHQGNLAAASRQGGMDRKNLWALAKKYGVRLDAIRASRRN